MFLELRGVKDFHATRGWRCGGKLLDRRGRLGCEGACGRGRKMGGGLFGGCGFHGDKRGTGKKSWEQSLTDWLHYEWSGKRGAGEVELRWC